MTESMHDCRHSFSARLLELARSDERVVLVLNDCLSSSDAMAFLRTFPDRVFDVGIAEQNMVGVAAGLANGGFYPFVCAASCFLTGRAFEQIKVDIAYSRANVKLCGFSSGVAYGALGPTHHSTEDLALMRAVPGMTIYAPADGQETERALDLAYQTEGPAFLRINRLLVPYLPKAAEPFDTGKASVLRHGADITLIGYGPLLHEVVRAADLLSEMGIEASVLSMASIAPLDEAAVIEAASTTGAIVVVEDHQRSGGLFSAVAEVLVQFAPAPVLAINVPNEFAVVGSPQEIFSHYGLHAKSIATKAADFFRNQQFEGGRHERSSRVAARHS